MTSSTTEHSRGVTDNAFMALESLWAASSSQTEALLALPFSSANLQLQRYQWQVVHTPSQRRSHKKPVRERLSTGTRGRAESRASLPIEVAGREGAQDDDGADGGADDDGANGGHW